MEPVVGSRMEPPPRALSGFQLHEPFGPQAVMSYHLGKLPHDARAMLLMDELEETGLDALL
jgi:hypothetical protein